LNDIIALQKAAQEDHVSYYLSTETLDKWVGLEGKVLDTFLGAFDTMSEEDLSMVEMFLILEKRTFWKIKVELIKQNRFQPCWFEGMLAINITDSFKSFTHMLTPAQPGFRTIAGVADALNIFKHHLSEGLKHLATRVAAFSLSIESYYWPTEDVLRQRLVVSVTTGKSD